MKVPSEAAISLAGIVAAIAVPLVVPSLASAVLWTCTFALLALVCVLYIAATPCRKRYLDPLGLKQPTLRLIMEAAKNRPAGDRVALATIVFAVSLLLFLLAHGVSLMLLLHYFGRR
jgi:hypothetical protein